MRQLVRRSNPGSPDASQPLLAGLLTALSNTGVSALYCGEDLKIQWARNLSPTWSRDDVTGLTLSDILPDAPAEAIAQAQATALTTGKRQILSIALPEAGGQRWFCVWIDPLSDANGVLDGLVVTILDITDQRWRETTLRALLREVAHRSKNMLAIVQSIVNQTGRHSDTIQSFLRKFSGRIQSLAASQDLVTSSNWRGADLSDLVQDQVVRYVGESAGVVELKGAHPYLTPNASLHIGLALHELVVNSVSFGALSRAGGTVSLESRFDDARPDPNLVLTWSEAISEDAEESTRKRFGSVALERIVPVSIGGEATLTMADGQLDYRLVIPNKNFEA